MSNFGEFPFYYGQKPIRYHTVESFYQMLTEPDEKLRKSIAKMAGKEAKRSGKSQTAEAKFEGKIYKLGSAEHHDSIKEAMRAKLDRRPDLARRFAATRPRPIVHETPGSDSTRFPAAVFCRILTELRDEIASVAGRPHRNK